MSTSVFRKYLEDFEVPLERLHSFYLYFAGELKRSLSKNLFHLSDLMCIPTAITSLPQGYERGRSLTIVINETQVRVSLVVLMSYGDHKEVTEVYELPDKYTRCSLQKLLTYVAFCLESFLYDITSLPQTEIPLGVIFPLPCYYRSLSGVQVIKNFGKFNLRFKPYVDVGLLLEKTIDKLQTIKIGKISMMNDATNAAFLGAYNAKNVRIGLHNGDYCNACYFEALKCVERADTEYKRKSNMLINIEWGALGEKGYLEYFFNKHDIYIDEMSSNRGKQLFNKLVSGKYIIEMWRVVLTDTMIKGLIFKKNYDKVKIIDAISYKNALTLQLMGYLERCGMSNIKHLLDKFEARQISYDDLCALKGICSVIIKRAAYIVAVPLSVLVNKIAEANITIAVDGDVFREVKSYEKHLRKVMDYFVCPKISYEFVCVDGNTACGPALLGDYGKWKATIR
ncbi:hexokinase-1-like [Teleopsis dalmanni]|uniref:hexokinase-1-like n=1 Tax=Teleopsis dalmanni TaxID=139649 RepID=UPI0018CDABFD|nr:hexokinase-1-like [Teleopsis dalmanni]XP_037930390.1 hexokinase-1-like [Teleopsis dalmanni]